MSAKFFVFLIFLCVQCFSSFAEDKKEMLPLFSLDYAKGFHVDRQEGMLRITVSHPWKKGKNLYECYLFNEKILPNISFDYHKTIPIHVPVKTVIVHSSPYIGFLKLLGVEKRIIGVSELRYVYDNNIRDKIRAGTVLIVGDYTTLDIERIITAKPSLVIISAYDNPSFSVQLKKMKIPVIRLTEWMEETPLGRAEWIKMLALLFGKEKEAKELFNNIAARYHRITSLASSVQKKPIVLVGSSYKGTWYTPGGNSFMSRFLQDAGAEYPWGKTSSRGSLPLSFEAILEQSSQADVWINAGNFIALKQLISQDPRYRFFQPFTTKKVYNPVAAMRKDGATDYWETGVAQPDKVLADLVSIFHPDLLPNHQKIYYQQLDEK